MDLDRSLVKEFAEVAGGSNTTNSEGTVYGTIVEYNGELYAQIDGSNAVTPISTTAKVKIGDRVIVTIKNHEATVTGNMSDPSASSVTVSEIGTQVANFDTIIADKANITELNAQTARIDTLEADNVTINSKLTAYNASIEKLEAKDVEISGKLTANEADINTLKTDYLSVNQKLTANEAEIGNLKADNVSINGKLAVNEADISKLKTDKLDATTADIKYATIDNLNATSGKITNLESDVADIDTLIFGSASGTTIQTSFANAVIAQLGNAQIKSAMIESVSADKITAGDIITNNVRVLSEDGKLLISDETIQISDDNRVRVQIGKDSSNDYSINIWDADGNLMFSKGGITDNAIKEAIIRNDMVSDTANISASKLNIDSLFTEINNSSKTIKSSKVYLDDKNQTLDVAFTSMTSDLDSLDDTVTSQGTQLSVVQGQISSKVWQQDIDTAIDDVNGDLETLGTQYSELSQTVSGFKTEVSETYATKNDVDNITIGGINLIQNGSFEYGVNKWSAIKPTVTTVDSDISNLTKGSCIKITSDSLGDAIMPYQFIYDVEPNTKYTLSYWYKAENIVAGTTNHLLHPYIVFSKSGDSGYTYVAETGMFIPDITTTDGWVYREATFSMDDGDFDFITFYLYSRDFTGTVYYDQIKLEKGSKATDWSPNPKDVGIDISALNANIETNKSSINQLSTEISTKVTQTEVDKSISNLTIGGRNLYKNSDKLHENIWSYDTTNITYEIATDSVYGNIVKFTKTSSVGNFVKIDDGKLLYGRLTPNEDFTVSLLVKGTPGEWDGRSAVLFYYNSTSGYKPMTPYVEDSSDWHWVSYTFNLLDVTPSLHIGVERFSELYIARIQVEVGNKATDWKKAIEDTEARVSQNESSITQLSDSIKSNVTSIDGLTSRMSEVEQTAEGLTVRLTTAEGNIDNASKTATNFLSYDAVDELQVGNKQSGSWAGFRAQVKSTAFNILNAAGEICASYGAKLIELGKNATDAIIKLCGGIGQIEYDGDEDFLQMYSANNVRIKSSTMASLYAITPYSSGVVKGYTKSVTNASADGVHIFSEHATEDDSNPGTYSVDTNEILIGPNAAVDNGLVVPGIAMVGDYIQQTSRYGTKLDTVEGNVSIVPNSGYYTRIESPLFVSKSGKSQYNDNKMGTYIGVDGTIHLATDNWGGSLAFHYKSSAAYTSLIKENSSGVLTINGMDYGVNKILASPAMYMQASHTVTLSEAISAQPHGIVLVFSRYSNSTPQDYHYNNYFIPKAAVSRDNGGGYLFLLSSDAGFGLFGAKYLYIDDTQIRGHANNVLENQTGDCGIKYSNKAYVLRYVIGV